MRMAIILALALGAGGCELILGIDEPSLGPGNPPGEGDGGIDPRTEEARLGFPCGDLHADNGFGGGCPGESVCVFDLGNFGSPGNEAGYCSPFCFDGDPSACIAAYDGPPEGDPSCGPPEIGASDICVVGLNGCLEFGDQACPPEMTCQPLFGDLVGCVPTEWTAGGGGQVNALGQLCGPDFGGCPVGHICISEIADLGDPAGNGYCSPDCSTDPAVCSNGYTGPAEGDPVCAIDASMSGLCGIGCAGAGDAACPNGMSCYTYQTAQGPIQGCGGPTWTALPQ